MRMGSELFGIHSNRLRQDLLVAASPWLLQGELVTDSEIRQ